MSLAKQANKYLLVNKEVAKLLPHKTMTRRLLKDKKGYADFSTLKRDSKVYAGNRLISYKFLGKDIQAWEHRLIKEYSKFQVGDILWIREPVKVRTFIDRDKIYYYFSDERDRGLANKNIDIPKRFKDLKHKPKWLLNEQGVPNGCLKEMARHFVKITNIKIERLQDVTPLDLHKEGCPFTESGKPLSDKADYNRAYRWFIDLWNSTAPKGCKWEDNPPVVVYEWEYLNK